MSTLISVGAAPLRLIGLNPQRLSHQSRGDRPFSHHGSDRWHPTLLTVNSPWQPAERRVLLSHTPKMSSAARSDMS